MKKSSLRCGMIHVQGHNDDPAKQSGNCKLHIGNGPGSMLALKLNMLKMGDCIQPCVYALAHT